METNAGLPMFTQSRAQYTSGQMHTGLSTSPCILTLLKEILYESSTSSRIAWMNQLLKKVECFQQQFQVWGSL